MSDFFTRLRERLSSQTSGSSDFVAFAVDAPIISPVRLSAEFGGEAPLSFWNAAPSDDGPGLALVGFGETVRLQGHGAERAQQIMHASSEVYAAIRVEQLGQTEPAPGLFFLGGLSFRPSLEDEPWANFSDASFSLPRWTYVRHDNRAWVWLCIDANLSKDKLAEIFDELAALERAMRDSVVPQNRQPFSTSVSRVDVADRDAYCALVAKAIAHIRTRATDKIVAVTSSHVTFDKPIDARMVLGRLDETYPDTNRFAVQRGERVFVGASPERLVARRGRRVDSDGLAGTARRGVDDAAIARGLLTSAKDRREHALVVDAISTVLGARCSALSVPDEPRVRTLRNVHHLWTPIRGVLRNETHVLDLVAALHPTPAVSGTPRELATAWIAEHEPRSRGWYTGAVGYFDAAGDGEFAVAIRAGLVGKTDAYLYAGAGIVEASDPPAEYAETRAKEVPMLSALGIAP